MKTSQIRQSFLDYFKGHDHKVLPSGPVVPYNDPTLLFTNAGMNQFKEIFTGQRKVDYKRATTTQKCIRAGGKHNDLDNVGFTARHHTFFEMLGNFSFGDYFKEEAIKYAWDWVTVELGLPKDKLYATVYDTDDDAFELWEKIAPELKNGRILRFGKKDNYWSMGDIGPCGPCSEIHIDRGEKFGTGPNDVVNGESDRFMEIWNLVFMQYDQQPDGKVVPLPKPSVDTGAGLERIASIMQNASSNYGIDLFRSLIAAISDLTNSTYKGDNVPSHQVIADHLRALTFAIADGAGISNEGQGYVLRRILRRAARHGRLLGMNEPFIYKLVPALISEMGTAFPEIAEKQKHIETIIQVEEESFGHTLDTGLSLFEKVAASTSGKVIKGAEVFKLYDTYGFPYDLTEIMAAEKGLTLDRDGFDKAMTIQRGQSRSGSTFDSNEQSLELIFMQSPPKVGPTMFERETLSTETNLLYIKQFPEHDHFAIILDKTPMYVEAGGQTGDIGRIYTDKTEIEIKNLFKYGDWYVHEGVFTRGSVEDISEGSKVTAEVDFDRRWEIMRNHTATHLTHKALRTVLGDHVKQSGSYVGPDHFRFDFSHHQPITPDEISKVEQIVNDEIIKGTSVKTDVMDIEAAKATGAMALFGEKYDEQVRVVSVDDFSKELCGGTHVENTGQIGPFIIVLETGIASGVRRIEAITGQAALKKMLDDKAFKSDAVRLIGHPEEPIVGLEQLKEENLALQKEIKKIKAEMFSGNQDYEVEPVTAGKFDVYFMDFKKFDKDSISGWADNYKNNQNPSVAFGVGEESGKQIYIATASATAIHDQNLHVGHFSGSLASNFGGKGGGKQNFAQGTIPLTTDLKMFKHSLLKKLEEM